MRLKSWQLCVFLLSLRLWNALSIKTFFQPDEYYQSLEVAHDLVYKYGYLTWEWKQGIRSIAHPMIFTTVFKLLQTLGVDSRGALIVAPKVLQAAFAALGDYYTYLFACTLYGSKIGRWALFCSVFSTWNWYTSTRTFSNSLETSLTAMGLYYWPWHAPENLVNDQQLYAYLSTTIASLASIGLACLIRPTNALVWLIPAFKEIMRHRTTFVFEATFVAYVVVQYSVILDSFYYGKLSFPLWQFLKFNFFSSNASFYGTNSFHYYLSQALPMLTTGFLPFTIYGLWAYRKDHSLTLTIVFVISTYSILLHKEVRFISPLSPILLTFSARAIHSSPFKRYCLPILVGFNVALSIYGTRYHQRGVIDVVDWASLQDRGTTLWFLMPCHSTPWQSHIHRPDLDLAFLTCEPLGQDKQLNITTGAYRDEADLFYDDMTKFLNDQSQEEGWVWPTYLVIFEERLAPLQYYFAEENESVGLPDPPNPKRPHYTKEVTFWNSHFHDDWRRQGDVIVLAKEDRS